jgi:putative NADH-flavin reductase
LKITVFGASGATGAEVVRRACEAGHEVTAVVRGPGRLDYRHELLRVVVADVMDVAAIGAAVAGSEAVVTAIGSRTGLKPTTVQTDSTASIVAAMGEHGVRRLVAVSTSGMTTEGDGPVTRALAKPLLGKVFRHPWGDMREMESLVRASGLDWTFVRPSMLTDGPRTDYRTAVDRNVRGGIRNSRADVADLVLRSLGEPSAVGVALALGT